LLALAALTAVAITPSTAPGQDRIDPTDEMLLDADGKPQRPLQVEEAKANVLIFISTECPIANGYLPKINALVRDFTPKSIRFYLVHANPELTAQQVKEHVQQHSITAPVLVDRQHELVRATGVKVTPEVVVVLESGRVAYRGRIDDMYANPTASGESAVKPELREALNAVVADREVEVPRTRPLGCSIRELPAASITK
jgi:hypothetical protein